MPLRSKIFAYLTGASGKPSDTTPVPAAEPPKAPQPLPVLPESAPYTGIERRKEPRFVTCSEARLQVMHPPLGEHLNVTVLDVSRSGMRLHVPFAISPGSIVRLEIENDVVWAEVRSSNQIGNRFYVGVQLRDQAPKPFVSGAAT